MDGFEVRFGQVGVDLGRGDVGMAEHLLHMANAGPSFEHFSREGMA